MGDVKKLYNQISISLLLVFVIVGYSILILASSHCYPNAEDLQISSLAKYLGFNEAMKHLLVSADGRYSANVLYVISPYNKFELALVFIDINGNLKLNDINDFSRYFKYHSEIIDYKLKRPSEYK